MKRKNKRNNYKRKKEFRFKGILIENNKYIRHPCYIFLEKGNFYIYVNITHSKIVISKETIKLKANPNPLDKRDAFLVLDVSKDRKNKFGSRLKGWTITPEEDDFIRKLYKKR